MQKKKLSVVLTLISLFVFFAELKAHKFESSQESSLNVGFKSENPLTKEQLAKVKLTLTHKEDGAPLLLDEIKTTHTEKIHILIFDESLTDYQHYHPTETDEKGVYAFTFTPQTNNQYKAWVDLTLLKNNQQIQVGKAFPDIHGASQGADKTISDTYTLDIPNGKLHFKLSFDNPEIREGKHNHGSILITDGNGKPFKELEPILGAFAHIVAINQDFSSLAHVHPMGKEPTKSSDRGGPELKFGLDPDQTGFWKIWVQLQINGQSVNVPFGVDVS